MELQSLVLSALVALGLGAGIGWLVAFLGLRYKVGAARRQAENAAVEISRLTERTSRLDQITNELKDSTARELQLNIRVAALNEQLDGERAQTPQRNELLLAQFRALSASTLENNSSQFLKQSGDNIGQLIEPLQTKLREFQDKVESEGKERFSLGERVKEMIGLNFQLAQSAQDLTKALKGSAKAQGDYGEMILRRVLEACGMREGYNYRAQKTYSHEDYNLRPDIVVTLPGSRHLVIDAKTSLTAYTEYSRTEADLARRSALKDHIRSVRTHIKNLSEKNYSGLYQLNSVDFVIMFVPLDQALDLATANDNALLDEAWSKNVLIAGPTSLPFVIRIVEHLWKQEERARSMSEIVKCGTDLYEKLVEFVTELDLIGVRLRSATKCFNEARRKLANGRNAVIGVAERLRDYGLTPSKLLPQDLLDASERHTLLLPDMAAAAMTEEETDIVGVNK